jgi:lincosamide and streptogramin A transport system ATP-binding/permease protein
VNSLRKKGYILISHDRHFLDLCVDHIVSINKADIRVNQGSFSQWKQQMEIEEGQASLGIRIYP